MTSQWPDNYDTISGMVIYNSLDIDFISFTTIYTAGGVRKYVINKALNNEIGLM